MFEHYDTELTLTMARDRVDRLRLAADRDRLVAESRRGRDGTGSRRSRR
ncbi:MAG: hypothetical protein ACM30G_09480 [Micromonosporaceae bacterium]